VNKFQKKLITKLIIIRISYVLNCVLIINSDIILKGSSASIDRFGSKFTEIVELINASDKILITTHKNPDGDAIGSELALYHALLRYDKSIRIINCDPTPQNLQLITPEGIIEHFQVKTHAKLTFDLIFMLDGNHLNRLGMMQDFYQESGAKKILIDHHTEPSIQNDFAVVDTDASSTGELIYYFIKFLGIDINFEIAANLYLAIMTDTGSFRFPRTTSTIHLIIAELIEKGADPVMIYDMVYNTNTINSLHILGLSLSKITLYHEGKLAVMRITKDMLIAAGATNEDIDNFVNHTLSINGTVMGIMVAEVLGSDELRISMRSKGHVSVRDLAAKFGGGGHINAAGARINSVPIDIAIEQLVEKSKNLLNL